ncbi:MAG: cohesin domain-containing protein [Patescibacteria group bacterium]
MRQVLYKILFAFSLGLILPQIVFAAQISFDAKTTQTQVGKNFEVILFVNTEQENLNAFEGKVTFPNALLDLKEIRDGNTIVNFWIEKPKAQDNAIIFSGVTPGGFNGKSGLIFSVIFEAKQEGVAKFEVKDARILRNDGIGSMVVLSMMPLEVVISKEARIEIPAIQKIEDREQPELFVPEIARDESISDGEWFIAFITQDKVSGIDHYEIKESRQKILTFFSRWRAAESPHVLKDQELRSYIFVKAVDKAGNERIVKLSPQNSLRWYENYENWIILIVIAVVFASGAKKILWKKPKR